MGFFAQPPSCRAPHEGGYAESQIMPGNTWYNTFAKIH